MNLRSILSVFPLFLVLIGCEDPSENKLIIDGTIVGADISSVLIVQPGQDIRHDSVWEIPVVDGKFHYEDVLTHPVVGDLFLGTFKETGMGHPTPVFLENTKVKLSIYPDDQYENNRIEGGFLNEQYWAFEADIRRKFKHRIKPYSDSLNVLFDINEYDSKAMQELRDELRSAEGHDARNLVFRKMDVLREQNSHLTPKAASLIAKRDAIYKEMETYRYAWMEEHPSLVSWYFLMQDLVLNKENADPDILNEHQDRLLEAHPDHPYLTISRTMTEALTAIDVGKPFLDFTAPDLKGDPVTLSEKIEGKIALLDLWATWCGPCIAKSRTMIPVFEDFKDKGFTVVGVAGEFKNTDRLEKFLQKESWPWINLVELDRANNIWQKYGVDNAGGAIFLIDSNGEILAKDPTPEEVRNTLTSRLN